MSSQVTKSTPKEVVDQEDLIAFYRLENSALLKIPLEYFLKLAPLRIH
ncbi:hypothetical protein HOF92_07175 [bacterium]|nr:hypothetical protein [bacterium]